MSVVPVNSGVLNSVALVEICSGWANKNRTFLEIPYFCSTTDNYNHAVFAEVFTNYWRKQQATFFKRALNILCKVTGNGLHHSATRLLVDDQPGLG